LKKGAFAPTGDTEKGQRGSARRANLGPIGTRISGEIKKFGQGPGRGAEGGADV